MARVTVEDCIEILDNMRKPVSAKERASRDGDVPYYGATGQAGLLWPSERVPFLGIIERLTAGTQPV